MFVLGSAGVVGGILAFAAASYFGFGIAVAAAVIGGSISAFLAGVAMSLWDRAKQKRDLQRPAQGSRE